MTPKPENKPTIAVDIDDVVGAENEAVRQFINREYGHSHSAEDYLKEGEYSGYWENIWQVAPEDAKQMYDAFLLSPEKADLKVLDGAVTAINALKKRFELVVVTSRSGHAIEVTEPWLERHFPDTFRQIAFVALWNGDEKVTKGAICREIGASYLIDDNATHCNLAAEVDVKPLLYGDYGWNRSVQLNPAVTRVKNWQEVLEYYDGRDN